MHVPTEAYRKQIFALTPSFINIFMTACNASWLSNAIYFFQNGNEVSATVSQCALIASFGEAGRLIAAIPGGILVEKFGRKKMITITGILHVLCWMVISLNSSLIVIYIAQFALGIAYSLFNVASMIFLGEISSPEIRGKFAGFCQIVFFAGLISQSLIAVLFSSYYILCYCTTALSLLFFATVHFSIESPNYLISVSKLNLAEENLKIVRLGYAENEIKDEFEKLKKYVEEEKVRKEEFRWIEFWKSGAIRTPIITCILLYIFIYANGTSTIAVYMTLIYPAVPFIRVQYYPLINQLLQLAVSFCVPFYIDKYPRRKIYMVGGTIMIIVMAFCALTNYKWMQNDDANSKWLFLFGNILASVVHCCSTLPLCGVLRSEILPQAVIGLGGAFALIAQSGSCAVSYQLYDIITKNFGLYYLYIIFSIDSLILCLLVHFRLPESRGKLLSDIHSPGKKVYT